MSADPHHLARQLVRRWRALDGALVPADVRAFAALHCLDAMGVGIAAASLEQGQPYARYTQQAAAGPVSALNGIKALDAADAALVNGGLIHSLEYDDTHTESIVHGSAVLLPAALAVAQSVGASPAAMLLAYIKGYECLIRIGLAAQGGFQRHGFQITSVAGTLITALMACDLTGADEDQCVDAMGIALSQSSGVFEFLSNGSSVKSMHPGWSAHAGVVAARLAMAGLQGPQTSLEGQRGLFMAFARDPDAAARLQTHLADFGSQWHLRDVAFKLVPSCHYLHSFVEAAGELADAIGDVSQIERIHLKIAEGAAPIVCEPWEGKQNPATGHAIRWSLPVITAARFVEGKVDLDTFARSPSQPVLDLAARTTWEPMQPNRFPRYFEADVHCVLKDGRVLSLAKDDVLGNASRPVSAQKVLDKFHANAARSLAPVMADRITGFWLNIDEQSGFGGLADSLMASRNLS